MNSPSDDQRHLRPGLRRWLPDARGLPRPFWVLFAGTLVNRIGGFVLIFLAIYLTEVRDPTPADAGAIACRRPRATRVARSISRDVRGDVHRRVRRGTCSAATSWRTPDA